MSLLGIACSLAACYGQPWKRRRMQRHYGRFVEPGDLCIDVGAHEGNRVRTFRDLGARVVAVEPQPACVSVLEGLYGGDPHVTILPVGLASDEGTLELRVGRDERVQVEVTTLDALIQRHGFPSFVRIARTGDSEALVLQGLGLAVAALSFEYDPAALDRALACVDRLAELGHYGYLASEAGTQAMLWEEPVDASTFRSWLSGRRIRDRSGEVYAVRQDAR